MPFLEENPIDQTFVAQSIYGDFTHVTTSTTLVLEEEIKAELERFLHEYCTFLNVSQAKKFFRIDLYFDHTSIYVIEVNVEVADGWGVALNLLRAAGRTYSGPNLFPTEFPTFTGDLRQSEFLLAIQEFALLGHTAVMQMRVTRVVDPLDNKLHLARFSEVWRGERVIIPRLYWNENAAWDKVPQDVYLKFVDKFSSEALQARFSVKPRSELGKAKQMRRLFANSRAIAQQKIAPFCTESGEQVQAVVMCAGAKVVVGYIQVAPCERLVINDKGTKKGPLLFR